jgi:hypothetical protein
MQNIMHGEEVFGVTWNTPTRNVEGSKILLLHRMGLNVHSKQTSRHGVIKNEVAHALAKFSPSSSHHFVLSHPDDISLVGLVEVNSGI